MSYSTPLDNDLPGFAPRDRYGAWRAAVAAVIVACLTFNFVLAFVNTNLSSIRETHVILTELILVGLAFALALTRSGAFYALMLLFAGYMAFIFALRPELDLKAVRDVLIALVFYFVGRKVRSISDADRIVMISAAVVAAVGLFEFLQLEQFTALVNIFDYYVARGTLSAGDNFVEGSNLFISSTRLEGRNFLPFLGQVRASSVFLEPVTMGNFGAFLFLWALYRNDMKGRYVLAVAGALVIILGDARFGLFVCLAFAAALPFIKTMPRLIWWLLPFVIMAALVIIGQYMEGMPWEDDFIGRVVLSGQLITKLTWTSTFGISRNVPFFGDSGYAYTLGHIGLIGIMMFWSLFMFAPEHRKDATRFKALAAIFICLLLIVSSSLFSIKLAALFWFTAGAVDADNGGTSISSVSEDAVDYARPSSVAEPIRRLRALMGSS